MLKLTLSFFKSGLLSLGLIYNKSKIHPRLIPPRWAFVNFLLSITLSLKFRIQSIMSRDKNLKRFDRKKDTTGLKLKIETFLLRAGSVRLRFREVRVLRLQRLVGVGLVEDGLVVRRLLFRGKPGRHLLFLSHSTYIWGQLYSREDLTMAKESLSFF